MKKILCVLIVYNTKIKYNLKNSRLSPMITDISISKYLNKILKNVKNFLRKYDCFKIANFVKIIKKM